MSLKGKTFTAADAPSRIRSDKAKAEAWAAEQTERYRVVAMDGERPVIADELQARALARLSPKARRAAGLMLRYPADVRREILAAFGADGELKLPFKFIE